MNLLVTDKYTTEEDLVAITSSNSFEEVVLIAETILARLPKPIGQICGPISTGNKLTPAENLVNIHRAITIFQQRDLVIFSQLPFERVFDKILGDYHSGYDTPILQEFYHPLFRQKLIDYLIFLPGWEHSTGARWEYDCAKKLGVKTIILGNNWENNIEGVCSEILSIFTSQINY